jgi:hypothetical protein
MKKYMMLVLAVLYSYTETVLDYTSVEKLLGVKHFTASTTSSSPATSCKAHCNMAFVTLAVASMIHDFSSSMLSLNILLGNPSGLLPRRGFKILSRNYHKIPGTVSICV